MTASISQIPQQVSNWAQPAVNMAQPAMNFVQSSVDTLGQTVAPMGHYVSEAVRLPATLPQAIQVQSPIHIRPEQVQATQATSASQTNRPKFVNDLGFADWMSITGDPLHSAVLTRMYYHPTNPRVWQAVDKAMSELDTQQASQGSIAGTEALARLSDERFASQLDQQA